MREPPLDGPPTADEVALAIVAAARIYEENPLWVARGAHALRSRDTAFCALQIVFPNYSTASILRTVGAPKGYLASFEKGLPKAERQLRYKSQWHVADCILELSLRPKKTPALTMRRKAIPGNQCDDITADLMAIRRLQGQR